MLSRCRRLYRLLTAGQIAQYHVPPAIRPSLHSVRKRLAPRLQGKEPFGRAIGLTIPRDFRVHYWGSIRSSYTPDELRAIVSRMEGALPVSVNVVGERRIGKSSLLYHLFQTGEQRVRDPARYDLRFAQIYWLFTWAAIILSALITIWAGFLMNLAYGFAYVTTSEDILAGLRRSAARKK